MIKCTKCKSKNYVKAVFNHGKQRYKSKECGRQFTKLEDSNATNRAFALYLYIVGLSMNTIARMFGVVPSTVLYWVRNFALWVYEKPTLEGDAIVKLDEMWHFLESKKLKFGCGRHIVAVPVNWLIGSAETETQQL